MFLVLTYLYVAFCSRFVQCVWTRMGIWNTFPLARALHSFSYLETPHLPVQNIRTKALLYCSKLPLLAFNWKQPVPAGRASQDSGRGWRRSSYDKKAKEQDSDRAGEGGHLMQEGRRTSFCKYCKTVKTENRSNHRQPGPCTWKINKWPYNMLFGFDQ